MENLGKMARDKVTGFEGIIIGKTSYLFGCDNYGVTPKASDGDIKDTRWFDKGRIEIIGDGVSVESVQDEKPGGDDMFGPNNRVY